MTQLHPASQSDAVHTGCENLYCVCWWGNTLQTLILVYCQHWQFIN